MLKNDGSYEKDIQQRCARANPAFNSLTKCPWSTSIANEVKLRVYLAAIRSITMNGSETWAAPAIVMGKLECMERKLFRRLLGYFWALVCYNEELYSEVDMVCRRMTRGKHQHPSAIAPPSKVATGNCLRFLGHVMRTGDSLIVSSK